MAYQLYTSGGGGAQASNTRAKSHVGRSGGLLPQENLTLRVFLIPSDSVGLDFFFVWHTEKYTHLENEGI